MDVDFYGLFKHLYKSILQPIEQTKLNLAQISGDL